MNEVSATMAAEYSFELVEGWGKLPPGWSFKEVAAVATDSKDQVYVFTRGEHPVIVFDREGNFLRSWGEGQFARPRLACLHDRAAIECP